MAQTSKRICAQVAHTTSAHTTTAWEGAQGITGGGQHGKLRGGTWHAPPPPRSWNKEHERGLRRKPRKAQHSRSVLPCAVEVSCSGSLMQWSVSECPVRCACRLRISVRVHLRPLTIEPPAGDLVWGVMPRVVRVACARGPAEQHARGTQAPFRAQIGARVSRRLSEGAHTSQCTVVP